MMNSIQQFYQDCLLKFALMRQHPPTKIIVERHYVGTEKMETVFKRIAEEQITKKVKEIAENSVN